MMALGNCSLAEYHRMVMEKSLAAHRTAEAVLTRPGAFDAAAALAPWHRRATANARRLRRKGGA
jgi:hypothetical protein